uniref:Uncharacterized protein n=1 Tax=Arundo donax TaxID=35708 RepID=A0A0A9FJZ1_ARUDO
MPKPPSSLPPAAPGCSAMAAVARKGTTSPACRREGPAERCDEPTGGDAAAAGGLCLCRGGARRRSCGRRRGRRRRGGGRAGR